MVLCMWHFLLYCSFSFCKKVRKMNTKTINLLIVEDKFDHQHDARNAIEAFNSHSNGVILSIDYAPDLFTAQQLMQDKKYDGIVTDVFFPNITGDPTKRGFDAFFDQEKRLQEAGADMNVVRDANDHLSDIIYNLIDGLNKNSKFYDFLQAYYSWNSMTPTWDPSSMPNGVLVAEEAYTRRIPFVFCTDSHHHGDATEPVNRYVRQKQGEGQFTRLYDLSYEEQQKSSPKKPWREAIQGVLEHILRK